MFLVVDDFKNYIFYMFGGLKIDWEEKYNKLE